MLLFVYKTNRCLLSHTAKQRVRTPKRYKSDLHQHVPDLEMFKRAITHSTHKRKAVTDDHGSYTYGDLLGDSAVLAYELSSASEDLKENRVGILVPNGYDYVRALWAIWRAGGTAVPLCNTHPVAEMEYFLSNTKCSQLFVSPDFEDMMRPVCDKHGIKAIKLSVESRRGDRDTARDTAFESLPIDSQRSSLIIHTSGTTGKPKGVVLTHSNIQAMVSSLIDAWEWTSKDHILHTLPLHHCHGIVNKLLCCLWAGAHCTMFPKFDASRVCDFITNSPNLTLYMAVPTIYSKMIQYLQKVSEEERSKFKEGCQRLRLMVSGSMALPEPTFYKWETLSGHKLLERYGMTEIGMGLSNPLNGDRIPGRVGTPLPGVQVRIVPTDKENPHYGALQIKGPQVFKEYFGKPEATAKEFDGDWFKTGDVVEYRPTDGTYRIAGRASVDIIKSGGFKISALEIEAVLLNHPDIAEIAILGVEDEEWGQIVGAIVALEKGRSLTLPDLKEWASGSLAHYKLPRKLVFLDTIPRNAMGKMNKKQLIKHLQP